jgi:hypothetical protein
LSCTSRCAPFYQCASASRGEVSSMRSFRKELWFTVPARRGFINITSLGRGLSPRERHHRRHRPRERHAYHRIGLTSTMTSVACTRTLRSGWKVSPPMNRSLSIDTIPAKTTPTPISSGRSWAARSSSLSPRARLTSDRGNRSSTASSAGEKTRPHKDHRRVTFRLISLPASAPVVVFCPFATQKVHLP